MKKIIAKVQSFGKTSRVLKALLSNEHTLDRALHDKNLCAKILSNESFFKQVVENENAIAMVLSHNIAHINIVNASRTYVRNWFETKPGGV